MGVTESTSRLLGLSLVLALLLGTTGTSASAQTPSACVEGFDTVESPSSVHALDVLATSSSSALLAGNGPNSLGVWSARIVRFDGSGWHTVATKAPRSGSSGLIAIAGDKSKGRWAVGFARDSQAITPISVRQLSDGRWKSAWVPRSGVQNAVLTDVAVRTKKAAWAVGYRYGAPGTQMPHVLRWNGKRWSATNPSLAAGERGMLTAVSSNWASGTWIAGSVTKSRVERPYVARRVDGKWKRLKLPWTGQGSITSIMVTTGKVGWAVGYRVGANGLRPLTLRWNGQEWTRVASPDLGEETILLDVDIDDGDVVVVGSSWDPAGQRMRPIVARRHGSGWQVHELKGFEIDAVMASIDGLANRRGYLLGKSNTVSALIRTCEGDGVGVAARKSARQDRRAELAERDDHAYHEPESIPEPRLGLAAAPELTTKPPAKSPVAILERAGEAGLPT